MSTQQAANQCGVHYTTIRRWILEGKLPAFETPGGHLRIQREDLETFLESRKLRTRSAPSGVIRVLIVDDEEVWRESVLEFLKGDKRFSARGATDGFEAGRFVTEFQPDVVVLDLLMPGLNGFDVCKHLKASPRTRHTKILVLTAFATEDNVRSARECGADEILAKPVELDDLKSRIEALFAEESESKAPDSDTGAAQET